MRLEPTGNPIDEKAGEVLGLLSGWTADAIGGRNLALKSGGTHLSSAGNSYNPSIVDMDGRKALAFQNTNTIYLPTYNDLQIKAGDQIAFSFMAKASKPLSIGRVYIGPGSGNNNHLSGQTVTTEWERYSFTYTVTTDSEANLHMYPILRNEDGTSETYYITEWKLEYGSKATPWTPAPEDVAQALPDGETPTSPLPPHNPAHDIRTDTSVGTRVLVGDTIIYGDTGLRDITGSTRPGWLGTPHIQRLGDTVYLSYDTNGYLRPDPSADTTNHPFLRVPVGFRPRGGSSHGLGSLNNGYTANPAFVYGATDIMTTSRGTSMFGTLSWITTDPWPTTLPGVPKT